MSDTKKIVITNRVFAQASKRLKRIAAKRTDPAVKAAWLAASELLAKKGGAK